MNIANISGKTKIAGILGNPVVHSLSPKIHNYLFEKFKIDAVYVPFHIKTEEDLQSFVKTFRGANFLGCNITIPYKSAVLQFCDEISNKSQITKTANTLYWNKTKLCAETTDYFGFITALNRDGFDIKNKNALFLGNGGTARTLAVLLSENNPKSVSLVGRNKEKLENLAKEITNKTKYGVSYCLFDEAKEHIYNADIIINCTSVGMHPNTNESPIENSFINPKTYLFDAIYNPIETKFLREGKAKGCRTQNGLKMLIFQALQSFSVWTEKSFDIEDNLVNELENLLFKEFEK